MNNEIIISNIDPQNIIIEGGGSTIGITTVYVNDVDVTVGSAAYVVVPTKLSELQNNVGFITSAQEQDPTVPYYVKQISISDINNWNSKQDELVSGSNIKTINGESILGEGNLNVDTSYTAGTGISISDENVISNTITSYDDLTDLPTIPTAVSELTNDADYVSSSVLSPVAFSGDYDDLVDKPTIPTSTSDLDNDSGFITNRVDDLINYYTRDFLYGLLPKVSDEDTSINLSDTYASKLKLDLNSTELTQDATPTPSSPEAVHVITGENIIKVIGKNLFDKSITTYKDGYIKNDSGVESSNSDFGYTTSFIELQPNTQYTINGNISTSSQNARLYFYDNNQNWISRTTGLPASSFPYTFTTPNNCYYIQFQYVISVYNADTIIINAGSTSLPYESYVSTSYTVDLDTIKYCKIGTYADRIFRNVEGDPDYDSERTGTWYLKKNIGYKLYNGTESWELASSSSTHATVIRTESDMKLAPVTMSNYLTSSGSNSIAGSSSTQGRVVLYIENDIVGIVEGDNNYQKKERVRTWLTTHNTDFYYQLITPTYTEITGDLEDQLEEIYQNAMSYTGQTNISQVYDDLPFTISATTLKDISNL